MAKAPMDLAFYQDDELIGELAKRNRGLLVAGVRVAKGRSDKAPVEETWVAWRGGLTQAHGLAVLSEEQTKQQLLE